MRAVKRLLKEELKNAKFFDSYFLLKDVNELISDMRPYSPRSSDERAAVKLANRLDSRLVGVHCPSGGISVVVLLYVVVELRFAAILQGSETFRTSYYKAFDSFIRRLVRLDHYPYVLFTGVAG